MKQAPKIIFFLIFIFFFTTFSFCQETLPPVEDEEFNLFLFSLAFIFISGLIGAAIVGALLAILIAVFVFALTALGIVTTSVLLGLYKRSFSAGFASLLYLVFCLSCIAISTGGLFLVNFFITIPYSNFSLLLTGLASGMLAGLLLGYCTYKIIQLSIKAIARRLSITQ